jgi:hypothetical protein
MNQKQFYQWLEEIRKRFPSLKKWQATGLAMMSYGIIKSRHSQASLIAEELPEFGKASTVERRIQRWIANPRINVEEVTQSWAQWVLGNYHAQELYLLVDETKISDRIGCMMLSIAVEKRAIPLKWRCYRANSRKDYPPEGQVALILDMLKKVLSVVPEGKTVIVEADRGIGNSSRLMQGVSELGAYFLFRLTSDVVLTTEAQGALHLKQIARRGEVWHGQGTLFTKKRRTLECRVHILWEEDQDEPWCLATNLPTLNGEEYAFRVWQEESFRDLKSGGWQWQKSLTRNPEITERRLLAMVLAYTWCVTLGLLFTSMKKKVRQAVDYIRGRRKYCVFRMGLRFFKRYLYLDPAQIPLQIGPFPHAT